MNTYTLNRYEGSHAILIQQDKMGNELMILKDRLIEFAKPGDIIAIDFDHTGNLREVKIIVEK
ncbi:hypothetical protein [Halobacillus seohaensis]|uniref:DUF2283 domain-containing protein n=1 Tax=Halobacillus seohaensis TaxID=447421 RepID=A0ABW2ER56_9BACI